MPTNSLVEGEEYFVRVFAQNEAGLSKECAELNQPARASLPIGICLFTCVIAHCFLPVCTNDYQPRIFASF